MTLDQPPPQAPLVAESPAERDGLVETAVGVVTEPVATLRRVTTEANLGWAFTVILTIGVLSIASTVAQFRTTELPPGTGFESFLEGPGIVVAAVIGGTIGSILSLAIGAGILHLMAKILGGKGRYRGLFCGLAFASVPNVFQVPLGLAGAAFGDVAKAITGAIAVGISFWVLILGTVAVRENNDFTTGRAIAAVLIPIAAFIVLVIGLVILVALFFVVGVSESVS